MVPLVLRGCVVSRVYKVRLRVSGWVDFDIAADSEREAIEEACERFDDDGTVADEVTDHSVYVDSTDVLSSVSIEPDGVS
jgi:hypothetical protein